MKRKEYTKKDVEKIIILGRQKGYLTYDEVNDLLPEGVSSSEDIDRILDLLGSEDIQVVESEEEKEVEKPAELPKEDILSEQLKIEERFLPLDDPVKMYLKQMGSISLLSRDNEIELAKKIEAAEEKFKLAVLATKFARKEILAVVDDILNDKVNLEEVVKEGIKVRKNNILKRFKRITQSIRSTRSQARTVELILQFNFTTSVIEVVLRRLNALIRELEHIERQKMFGRSITKNKRSQLNSRKRTILRWLCEPYPKIKEQMKLIKSTHIKFNRTKKLLVEANLRLVVSIAKKYTNS